jgi:hypothetical protein
MMARALVAILVSCAVMVGCGGSSEAPDAGPQWDGNWLGPASVSGGCSDGSNVNKNSTASFGLKQGGGEVSYQASCGATIGATINGNVATIHQATCPSTTSDAGLTESITITGGSFTLNGNALLIDLAEHATFSGQTSATCDIHTTGTLTRQ